MPQPASEVEKKGVYPKYIVFHHPDFIPDEIRGTAFTIGKEWNDNQRLDPVTSFTFVLRPDRDHHARVALAAYAESVRAFDPQLAEDLDQALAETNPGDARMIPT